MKQSQFRHALWEARRKLKASPYDMARHMKVDEETYCKWETGAVVMPVAQRKRIIERARGLLDRCGLK